MNKKLINFDDLTEDPASALKKDLNTNDLQYQHFFRSALIGGTGVGKTNYLANILTGPDCLRYDRVWLLAKDASDPKYKYMQKYFEDKAGDVVKLYMQKFKRRIPPPQLFRVFKDVKEIPLFDDTLKAEESATVLIVDDFMNEKSVDNWLKNTVHFMRHFYISMFYLSQSWYQIPKFIRLQFDYVSFWTISDS